MVKVKSLTLRKTKRQKLLLDQNDMISISKIQFPIKVENCQNKPTDFTTSMINMKKFATKEWSSIFISENLKDQEHIWAKILFLTVCNLTPNHTIYPKMTEVCLANQKKNNHQVHKIINLTGLPLNHKKWDSKCQIKHVTFHLLNIQPYIRN